MTKKINTRLIRLAPLLAIITLSMAAAPSADASSKLFSLYVGGAYGHAELRAQDAGLISAVPGSRLGSFERGGTAYQLIAGIRGLDLLGAEIDYFDLGNGGASPSWSASGALTAAHVSQKGEAAFAVLYLPVPIIDVYVKAGVARLTTNLSASIAGSTCQPGYACPLYCTVSGCPGGFSASGVIEERATTIAAGGGVQWKVGDLAIRGEYERFAALGAHPTLISLGATWSFP